jgi:hypothetical protein
MESFVSALVGDVIFQETWTYYMVGERTEFLGQS